MKPLGSIAALVAAIRDDAAADAEALALRADATIAALAGDPAAAPPRFDDQQVLSAARDRARVRVSQEDWHDARDAVARREEWIERVVSLGTIQLRDRLPAAEARAALGALAREAIVRLPDGIIELVVSEADAPFLDAAWRASISPTGDAAGIRIVVEAIDGGCIARSADGRASFDNTYQARAERMQAQWRAALSDLYERVTSQIEAREAGG